MAFFSHGYFPARYFARRYFSGLAQAVEQTGFLPPTFEQIRPRRRNVRVAGHILVLQAYVVTGTVAATSANARLRSGDAIGDATADGAILAISKRLESGGATGERNLTDEELMLILAEAA